MRTLPLPAQAYILATIAAGIAAAAISGQRITDWGTFAALAVLFLVCDSAPAEIRLERARVTLSYAAGLASVVLLGADGAALIGALALVTLQPIKTPVKRAFNASQFVLCGWLAGTIYAALAPGTDSPLEAKIGPFVVALLAYVVLNLLLTGAVLLLARQATVREFLTTETRQLAPYLLGFGSFGLLIAGLWPAVGIAAPVLVLLPLLVARWAFAQAHAQSKAHEATLAALCQAVETKDFYTRGHSERVSRGSTMIGEELGMSAARLEAIRFAGMLHDVGKLGVPTKVLQKEGKLTEEEFAAIQLHPMRGLEIVHEIGFLDEALAGIMHHHEKLNGRGYPAGLAGDEIPEFARIIGVADAFDAMTSTRSYRKARPVEEGVAELERCAGTDFDPDMVAAFVRALRAQGWKTPEPQQPTAADLVTVTHQDHDDPTAPIRIAGEPA